MAYHAWDPELETGCVEVDDEHRSLFALANKLDRAIDGHFDEPNAVADAVYGLVGYVVEHFADEERLMAACHYPGLGPHKSLHEQLSGQTLEVMTHYTNGDDLDPAELSPMICDWLTNHIERHDKAFVAYKHRVESGEIPIPQP